MSQIKFTKNQLTATLCKNSTMEDTKRFDQIEHIASMVHKCLEKGAELDKRICDINVEEASEGLIKTLIFFKYMHLIHSPDSDFEEWQKSLTEVDLSYFKYCSSLPHIVYVVDAAYEEGKKELEERQKK